MTLIMFAQNKNDACYEIERVIYFLMKLEFYLSSEYKYGITNEKQSQQTEFPENNIT